jgi:hypothetical protein
MGDLVRKMHACFGIERMRARSINVALQQSPRAPARAGRSDGVHADGAKIGAESALEAGNTAPAHPGPPATPPAAAGDPTPARRAGAVAEDADAAASARLRCVAGTARLTLAVSGGASSAPARAKPRAHGFDQKPR